MARVQHRVPNTTNIHFDHIDGEAHGDRARPEREWRCRPAQLVRRAQLKPSHVLLAMGLRPDQARASIRLSLGKQTVDEDIDIALALVPETVARLRELSPVYKRSALSS